MVLLIVLQCRVFVDVLRPIVALNSLKSKVKYRISRNIGTVFVPADFADLSDSDQIGRALRGLVKDEVLIRFGRGLYAKAKRSVVSSRLIPAKPLPDLAREALTCKLGVEVIGSQAEKRYNSGQSTQVPTGRVIAVRGRVSRKMAFDGKAIKYQYVS